MIYRPRFKIREVKQNLERELIKINTVHIIPYSVFVIILYSLLHRINLRKLLGNNSFHL